jgi:hypothetical protein
LIFDLLQLNLYWQRNSKTKVEKGCFIFMSSYAEMSFFGPKKVESRSIVNNFCLQIGQHGFQKIRYFPLISKWGTSFTFVAGSFKS